MSKIKVEEIFQKHFKEEFGEESEKNGAISIACKAAIKEIVEEVLKKAADEAKTRRRPVGGGAGMGFHPPTVDKQSILDINKEVDYE